MGTTSPTPKKQNKKMKEQSKEELEVRLKRAMKELQEAQFKLKRTENEIGVILEKLINNE